MLAFYCPSADRERKDNCFFFSTKRISKNYLTKPHRISVGSINEVKKNIKHEYYVVGYRQKKEALKRYLVDIGVNDDTDVFAFVI